MSASSPSVTRPRPPRSIALMLESDGPGGAEVMLINCAEELRRRGHRVIPVLPSWKTGWLGKQFADRGFESTTFTVRRAIDLRHLRDLAADLSRLDIDVIHSHEFHMAVYGAAASKMIGRRHVITMHGNQTMTDARRRRIALRWAFRASHATVAVSEDTRRHLVETLSLPEGRVVTIPNGVPAPAGDPSGPREEFGISDDEVVFVAAGNLSPRKGHIVLLRALARVKAQGVTVPWRLIIAGEGPERPALEAFMAENGIADRVHLPGYRSDVGDLQAAGHVIVMPSLWEGLPLAILEGMHSGNAVIASRTSGIPEAVRDEVDGLLPPPGDVDALAAALTRVLEDRALLDRLAASALERARARFSVERMMDDYEALYFD